MNEHALRVLEYEKLREIVSGRAASAPGRRAAAALGPVRDRGQVERLLGETREFLRLLERGDAPPLDGIRDIAPQIGKLGAAGSMLSPAELLDVASTLAAGRRLKQFIGRREGPGAELPLLGSIAAGITDLKRLEDAVHAAVDEKAEVKDSASPALRRVRKQIVRTREDILDGLSRILRSEAAGDVVQESVITVRDDRYVLPLKPNFRQRIRGVVHGHSGSRATLFVEPLDVLEQNNRLAELRMEERDEIERILRSLTADIAAESAAVQALFSASAALDAVHARARFGHDHRGVVPELSDDGTVRLRSARHPLLAVKQRTGAGVREIAPNDLDLGGAVRALVLSGPNAGGKTVMLKTAGLLCLMAQSGIPVTAAEGTAVPVLQDVFADIGDDQSLEQDLSTFTSHATRIARILAEARPDTLVLLDELGAGTDPAEGAALGAAVLHRLIESGCITLVTTHHGGLKLFGSRTRGAVNAAMEFDPETLRPTYRFIPGRPGRSYGLDMARRSGIAEDVVRDAFSRLGEHEAGLDRLLEKMELDARELERSRTEAERVLDGARARAAEAAASLEQARTEAEAVKTRARTEARDVLDGLRRKLKELSRPDPAGRIDAASERRAVDALAGRLAPEEPAPEPGVRPDREFRAGERVRLPKLKRTGTVVACSKGALQVETGGKIVKVPAADAVPLGSAPPRPADAAPGWGSDLLERDEAPDRVNLLGLRVDEARETIERFLDRAVVNNLSFVTVIHGLGTGALKTLVSELLKQHPQVAGFRPGEAAEGGAGVTVVQLKK